MRQSLLWFVFTTFTLIFSDDSIDQVAVSSQFGHLPVLSSSQLSPIIRQLTTFADQCVLWNIYNELHLFKLLLINHIVTGQHTHSESAIYPLPHTGAQKKKDCLVIVRGESTVRHPDIHPDTTASFIPLGSTVQVQIYDPHKNRKDKHIFACCSHSNEKI